MDSLKSAPTRFAVRCLAALAAGLLSGAARADLITPDSIPQPPPLVGSAEGTPIYSAADLVTNQYVGRGLLFPTVQIGPGQYGGAAALTKLGGVAAWAPARPQQGEPWAAEIDYFQLTIQPVKPGTTTPTTVRSVTVELVGTDYHVGLFGLDANGGGLGGTTTPVGTGPHGGELLHFSGEGISSFEVTGVFDPPAGRAGADTPAIAFGWGVAGVEFTPATAPEPGTLALAGVGALALAGWTWRRRTPRAALGA